jgi:hypothetical protein
MTMKKAALILTVLLFCRVLDAQENTFGGSVLAYEWTTTHKTPTFRWPARRTRPAMAVYP